LRKEENMVKKFTTTTLLILSFVFFSITVYAWEIELVSSDNLTWEVFFTSDEGGEPP
jgi:hypothetical protein